MPSWDADEMVGTGAATLVPDTEATGYRAVLPALGLRPLRFLLTIKLLSHLNCHIIENFNSSLIQMRAISLGDRLLASVLNQIGDALEEGNGQDALGLGQRGMKERQAQTPHTPSASSSRRPTTAPLPGLPPRPLSPASRGPPGAGPSTTLHRPFPGVVSQGLWELSSGAERTHPPSLLSSRPHVCLVETRLLSSGPHPSLSNPHNEKTLLIPPLAPLPRLCRLQTPLLD